MFEQEKIESTNWTPKVNHHIHEKWMDFKRIRNKLAYKIHGASGRYLWTNNGIPYWHGQRWFNSNGVWSEYEEDLIFSYFNMPASKELRSSNGSVEWGVAWDGWGKPHVEGKSSRKSMKAKREWWDQAYETLHPYHLESVI